MAIASTVTSVSICFCTFMDGFSTLAKLQKHKKVLGSNGPFLLRFSRRSTSLEAEVEVEAKNYFTFGCNCISTFYQN